MNQQTCSMHRACHQQGNNDEREGETFGHYISRIQKNPSPQRVSHLPSKNYIWALVLFSIPQTQTDLSSPDQGRFFGLDDSELAVMSAIDAVEGGENPIPTHTHATMNLLKWKKKESVTSSYRSECGKENRKNNKRRRLHKNINSQKQPH